MLPFGLQPVVVSKDDIMRHVIEGPGRESFEHSTEGRFDVTGTRHLLHGDRIPWMQQDVPLSEICDFLRANRVFDPRRVDSLDEASWRYDPGIFVIIPEPGGDISHLMIDGTHRALRREKEGMETMAFYFVELRYAQHPGQNWTPHPFLDWGDQLIDGKIVKRGERP